LNKRATVWFLPVLLAVVTSFLLMTYVMMSDKNDKFTYMIGTGQGAVLSTQLRAEKAMFFIDMAAKDAERSAAGKLGRAGGFYEQPDCGSYLGVTRWNKGTDECWPEETEGAFERYFIDDLKTRLSSYPDMELLSVRYSVFPHDGKIYGYALRPLVFRISFLQPDVNPKVLEERRQETLHSTTTSIEQKPPEDVKGKYVWPAKSNTVTSCYGWRDIDYGSTNHRGIDIRAAVGDPVYAIADGEADVQGGMYNTLSIEHPDGLISMYLHNSQILVEDGADVKQGDLVALAGKAGGKYPHIHLTIKKKTEKTHVSDYVDPLDPALGLFRLESLVYSHTANCHYNCQAYAYCSVMEENLA
jgi:murein DD-endopeptidase MepM/ murein hydrolase activator NlpD